MVPPKYLYDERGSRLFDVICMLEEYYPTRTELGILEAHGRDIGARVGPAARVIELGSGSGLKTRLLLDALADPLQYVPVDLAEGHLSRAAKELSRERPRLDVRPICADYTLGFELPPASKEPRRTVVYFPGSTLGNLVPDEARAFLSRLRRLIGSKGALIVGVDSTKYPAVLHAAYNDPRGITAAFNTNLLLRANREAYASFELDRFRHYAPYNPLLGRVEMHLVSLAPQVVRVGATTAVFDEGESIVTEYSYKYTRDELARLAGEAGFGLQEAWTDAHRRFTVAYLLPR